MGWKWCCQPVCLIPSAHRGTNTWRLTRKFAAERCSCPKTVRSLSTDCADFHRLFLPSSWPSDFCVNRERGNLWTNKSSKSSFRRGAKTRSPRRPLHSPHINEDLPALDALEFENAVHKPGIVFQFFSHFIFIFSVNDQKRALRHPAFINQRTTH